MVVLVGLYALTAIATWRRWKGEALHRAALPGFASELGLAVSEPVAELDAASQASLYVASVRAAEFFNSDHGDGQVAGKYLDLPIVGSVFWFDIDGVLGSVLLLATPSPRRLETSMVVTHPRWLRELASMSVVPIHDTEPTKRVALASDDPVHASVILDPAFRRFILSPERWSKHSGDGNPYWFEAHADHVLIGCHLPGSPGELQHQLDALREFDEHLVRRLK